MALKYANNDDPLYIMIKNIFKTYNVKDIINSKWFTKLLIMEQQIMDINKYYYDYPHVLLYDLKIISFYKQLYLFEDDLVKKKKIK